MYPYSKFGIPISNNIRDMFWTRLFYKLDQRSRSKWPPNGRWHSAIKSCIYTPNLGFLPLIIYEICSGHNFLKTRSEVKVTVTHKWYKTLHHPKMHSHTKFGIPISNKIRDMLLTQLLLKLGQSSRSQWPKKWLMTLRHPKMHLHTKFGIPTSKNRRDFLWTK